MTGPTERLCAGVAGRRAIPWAVGNPGRREFVDIDAARGTFPGALDDGVLPRLVACDRCARETWRAPSTHRTSAGAVGYARCPCGVWLVLLDGRPLATVRPRPRAAEQPVPDERPPGRRRFWARWWAGLRRS